MKRNTVSWLSIVFLSLACALGGCKSAKPSEDAQRAAAESAKCAAEITAKCELDIATKCTAGDETCPAYVKCMEDADKVERGELCGGTK